MSTVAQNDKTRFLDLMGNEDQWGSIDELLAICDEGDFWTTEFLEGAEDTAKKSHLRRLIKSLKDEEGWPIVASLNTTNDEGETVRVYKQELLFDPDDYRQVVAYHGDRANHHGRMARGYAKRCDKRFKTRLHRQVKFAFDDQSADPQKPR